MGERKRIIGALLLSVMVVVFLYVAAPYLDASLDDEAENEEYRGFSGIIHVWHVVGFKPYSGSLGSALSDIAKTVEKQHYGIFYEVDAIDIEEYEMRRLRGETPDILSFPLGLSDSRELLALDPACEMMLPEAWRGIGTGEDGAVKSLAYAASSRMVLINTALMQEYGGIMPEKFADMQWLSDTYANITASIEAKRRKGIYAVAGDASLPESLGVEGKTAEYDAFRKGKASVGIADLRAVAEMDSLEKAGKGFPFEAFPLASDSENLVQFIAISASADSEKQLFAKEYVSALFGEKAQKSFLKLGLISPYYMLREGEAENDPVLISAYDAFDAAKIPNTFGVTR